MGWDGMGHLYIAIEIDTVGPTSRWISSRDCNLDVSTSGRLVVLATPMKMSPDWLCMGHEKKLYRMEESLLSR